LFLINCTPFCLLWLYSINQSTLPEIVCVFVTKRSAWPVNADTLCVRHYETNRKLAIISLGIKCVLCDWKSNKTLINIPKKGATQTICFRKLKHPDIDFLIYTALHLTLGLQDKHEVTGSWKGTCFVSTYRLIYMHNYVCTYQCYLFK